MGPCVVLGFRCQGGDLLQLSSRRLKILGQTVLCCAMRPLLLQVLEQARYPVICWGCWKSFPEGWAVSSGTAPPDQPEFSPHTTTLCWAVGLSCPGSFGNPVLLPHTPFQGLQVPCEVIQAQLWGWVPRASHPEYKPLPSRRRWGGSLFCELSALINLFKY